MGYYQGRGPVRISGKLYDSNSLVGAASSVLISTGVGVSWAPITDIATTSTDVIGGIASVTSLNVSGVATATSFEGSGTELTGIVTSIVAGTNITISGSTGEVTINASGSGGSTTLGTPTDTTFTDGLLDLTSSTTVTDAIDEMNEVLSKLAPAKPPNLSTKTLSLATSYSATESSTGTSRSNVTDDTTPGTTEVSEFWDGDSGTLSVKVDGTDSGSRVLTTGDDSNTYTSLIISDDFGYPTSGNGANFWRALDAKIQHNTALSVGSHTFQMLHSNTGNTPVFTFYVDNPTTVTISSTSFSVTGTSTNKISGVPTLSSGATFTANFTVNDAIKEFYNTSRIAAISGTSILSTTVNHTISGTQSDSPVSVTGKTLTVGSSKYSESPSITFTGYNSANQVGISSNLTLTNVRVDTVSTNESSKRKLSGIGTNPSTGYGGTYDSTQALNSGAYVNEMQYINGRFQYPASVDYSSLVPTAGPDYTTSMGTGTRWWCYQHTTSLSSITAFTLTINGTSGWSANSNQETSGVEIYAKVEGVTGWVDCNAPYPGVGNPTNDGDNAMVTGDSTATVKRVTFGTSRSGTLYIRIGFPSGSTKYFTGVSISSLA